MGRLILLLLITVVTFGLRPAGAGDPVVPGKIRVDSGYDHIGVAWEISGDDNLNSQMSLEFRPQGSGAWQPAALAVRAYPSLSVNGSPLNLNYWGASALFLESGVAYELRLTLTDPDGGGQTQIVTGELREEMQPDPAGRQLYVTPGNGGGSGSQGDPFQGLQFAADQAQPGDTFHILPGTYDAFTIDTSGSPDSPISFIADSGGVIINGDNTDRGVITIGRFDAVTSHIIIAGLHISDGAWGIDAQNTQNILIHRNRIDSVDFGVYNRRDNNWELNQTVCENMIRGRVMWPGSGIPSERGIDLRGSGNVICYNNVQYFGDCVSVQPSTGPSYSNDIYGNDISYCVDDGIEIDYNQSNVRVWRNRVMNARMGVSVQPIRGGPAYIFRNEFFNLESVPIKMHNETTGFVVVHNTGVKHGDGHGDNGAMWRNATFRNNLFLGTRYAFEFTTAADEGYRDFDYNGWGTSRAIGGLTAPFFKWDNVRYDRLPELQAIGVETHGVAVDFGDLRTVLLPADWNFPAIPGSQDLRLTSGSPAINAGAALANFNDGFTISGLPDLGAFEFGQPLPDYGPAAIPCAACVPSAYLPIITVP